MRSSKLLQIIILVILENSKAPNSSLSYISTTQYHSKVCNRHASPLCAQSVQKVAEVAVPAEGDNILKSQEGDSENGRYEVHSRILIVRNN